MRVFYACYQFIMLFYVERYITTFSTGWNVTDYIPVNELMLVAGMSKMGWVGV